MSEFAATRAEALERLAEFLSDGLNKYDRDRNYVVPQHINVSRLSPAISRGILVTEDVVEAVLERASFAQAEKFLQELYWRRYWKSWLELRPSVWDQYVKRVAELSEDGELAGQCSEMENGAGPVAVMNDFAAELRETGYLHNHARMWFAGYWIHSLKLPWELGADFFYKHLLDADAASNTLSWRWVAGWQTPGKTYLARRSNVEKFLDDRLLREGGLEVLEGGEAVARKGARKVEPENEGRQRDALESGKRTGAWVHSDALADSAFPDVSCVAVAAEPAEHLAKRSWLDRACDDAAERYDGRRMELGEIGAWARENELEQVVAIAPLVGVLDDSLGGIQRDLGDISLKLLPPAGEGLGVQATGGFFGYWKKVKKELGWR